MSEPTTLLVAAVTAVGALAASMDLPHPIAEQVDAVIESLYGSAGAVDTDLAAIIGMLPEPLRPAVERAVQDATVVSEDAARLRLPDVTRGGADPELGPERSEIAPAPPAARPSPFVPNAVPATGAGSSGVVLPPIPAILPGA